MNRNSYRALTFLLLLVSVAAAGAQVPPMFNYQGRLTSGGGLANGAQTFVFRLYDSPTGGSALYVETQTVTVVDGHYATSIGLSPSYGSLLGALTNDAAYLELTVGTTTLTPRERLMAVPYALVAYSVRGPDQFIDGSGNVGMGTTNPTEKLEVNGAVVVANTTNPVPRPGAIRWTGQDFEGFQGAEWVSLTSPQGLSVSADEVLIPGGPFDMGAASPQLPGEEPVHAVSVDPFYIEKYEVRQALWDEVLGWAQSNGYFTLDPNAGQYNKVASNHPVTDVGWNDAAIWMNARSEKEGLDPVYYISAAMTSLYNGTQGATNVSPDFVKWSANGYRFPTEAEWEKAARGGLVGHQYAWDSPGSDFNATIDGSRANYSGSGDPYESATVSTTPVGYYNGGQTPAGVDMANGYGLYDMCGNVGEWCFDWYDSGWYTNPLSRVNNTKGPPYSLDTTRVVRGGNWSDLAPLGSLRCAWRAWGLPTAPGAREVGFRCARTP